MGSYLDGLGTLFGGQGNAGAASSNAWNYGQYSPFTVNNPMGQTSFNGTTANQSLSPLQSQLQGAFGNSIMGGLQGAQGYSPYNPGFLSGQYNNIYGNMQGNANQMFNSLQSAQKPWTDQYLQSNLDNQFSKGTLASTAGSYQTAGAQQAANAQMNQNQATAQQFALSQAGQQFGAAQGVAGLGEQQAEFGPQIGLQGASTALGGLNTQNSQFLQQLQAAGNLGAQRSGANVAAATPGIGTGETQDQATSGLLSGLLFGGGTGGNLLSSLLGSNGGSGLGGLVGKGLSGLGSLFGGGGGGVPVGTGAGTGGSGGIDWSNLGQYGSNDSGSGGGPEVTNYDSGTTTNFDTPTSGNDNWWGGFSPAGGEAAKSNVGAAYNQATNQPNGFGSLLGTVGGALGAYQGLTSGNTVGQARGALSATQLASKSGVFGSNTKAINSAAGIGANALGIYSGIRQGGVAGYGGAAVNAAQLGSKVGAFGGASGAVGAAAGYAAIPLSLYNEVNNWESGATGSDALAGAETGAAIGSVVPVIGTAIGALIGGAAGALSSAFGSGRVDPENKNFEGYTQAFNKAPAAQQAQVAGSLQDPYTALAGMFDLRSGQIKGSIPIYNEYGRKGEQKFTNDLISKVRAAKTANPNESASDIFNKQVSPWIDSMGSWKDSNKNAMEALIQNMTGQIVSGSYKTNFKAIGGDSPFMGS